MPSPTSRPQWHLRRGALGRRGRALWRLHRRAEQHPRRPQHLLSLLPSCPRPPWPSKILARSTQMTGSTCLMKCPKISAHKKSFSITRMNAPYPEVLFHGGCLIWSLEK
ncbi:hypothetical protein PVAP13_7KG082700 [Panicum virgatum]|uniref:Uncharacterized protein n=1 Tax=Panicum virgatum TaxID=38727 RepID=A0A8T0Q7M1_PANVG|nr:hypothetical protein PVAP13_7KG031729 [Panicum virgatum]KAG2570903.1 hypothetical protein PVAP13_7KG082700 [Panicum virgatum]